MAVETTIQWGRGTKSYFAMQYRKKIDDKIRSPKHGFWIEAKSGEKLYEPLAGLLLIKALLKVAQAPDLYSIRFMKQDDERLTPETSYNEPYRFINGEWVKATTSEEQLQRIAGFGLLAISMIARRAS